MKRILFMFCLFTGIGMKGEGFVAGTLVKTPNGYIPIERLKKGDFVLSYDIASWPSHEFCAPKRVTATGYRYADSITKIFVNGNVIRLAGDHMLYLPLEKEWVYAHSVRVGDMLLKDCNDLAAVDEIRSFHQRTLVYDVSVQDYRNLCVSTEDILVHNSPFEFPLATLHFLKNRFSQKSHN